MFCTKANGNYMYVTTTRVLDHYNLYSLAASLHSISQKPWYLKRRCRDALCQLLSLLPLFVYFFALPSLLTFIQNNDYISTYGDHYHLGENKSGKIFIQYASAIFDKILPPPPPPNEIYLHVLLCLSLL